MALIRPCADLRNNYNEISRICHETKEPMYITKNGTNDLVVLSDEAYEDMFKKNEETEEERIDRIVSEHFDKYYASFEEFKKDILKIYPNAIIQDDYFKIFVLVNDNIEKLIIQHHTDKLEIVR